MDFREHKRAGGRTNDEPMEPLPDSELREILEGDEGARRMAYARLVDRYHALHGHIRDMRRQGEAVSQSEDIMRDVLHKQIERVGATLEKAKDMVLCDLIARDGNLSEYRLPEYGLVTPDLFVDMYQVLGFSTDDIRRGRFERVTGAQEVIDHVRKMAELNKYEPTYEPADRLEDVVFDAPEPGIGKIRTIYRILPGHVGVIFGTSFTADIHLECVEFQPTGFLERLRRAVQATEQLQKFGIAAETLSASFGGYHDTTRLVGVHVPADRLEEAAGVIRNNRHAFSISPDDLRESGKEDLRIHLEATLNQLLRVRVPLKSGVKKYLDIRDRFFGDANQCAKVFERILRERGAEPFGKVKVAKGKKRR